MTNDWYNQQQRNNNLLAIPVRGEEEAQNYIVGAGNTVLLIDLNSENKHLWLKSNDSNNLIQEIRTFELKEITPKPKQDSAFIQREEFDIFKKDVQSQLQQMVSLLQNLGGNKNDVSTNSSITEQSSETSRKIQRDEKHSGEK